MNAPQNAEEGAFVNTYIKSGTVKKPITSGIISHAKSAWTIQNTSHDQLFTFSYGI